MSKLIATSLPWVNIETGDVAMDNFRANCESAGISIPKLKTALEEGGREFLEIIDSSIFTEIKGGFIDKATDTQKIFLASEILNILYKVLIIDDHGKS